MNQVILAVMGFLVGLYNIIIFLTDDGMRISVQSEVSNCESSPLRVFGINIVIFYYLCNYVYKDIDSVRVPE